MRKSMLHMQHIFSHILPQKVQHVLRKFSAINYYLYIVYLSQRKVCYGDAEVMSPVNIFSRTIVTFYL